MPRFSSETKLPSLRVDKELLARVEEYAKTELAKMAGLSPDIAKRVPDAFTRIFSVSLTDSLGNEVLSSISEHRPAQLPDSIQRVVISFNSARLYDNRPRSLDIDFDISFSRERLFTAFSIKCEGEGAREAVVTIRDSILRLLEPHWSHNRFFHPGPAKSALLFMVGSLFLSFSVVLFTNGLITPASWSLMGLICIAAYSYAGFALKPWTTFDTRTDRLNDEWWRWFKFGVLGFVLFGTLFTIFRRRFLGF